MAVAWRRPTWRYWSTATKYCMLKSEIALYATSGANAGAVASALSRAPRGRPVALRESGRGREGGAPRGGASAADVTRRHTGNPRRHVATSPTS